MTLTAHYPGGRSVAPVGGLGGASVIDSVAAVTSALAAVPRDVAGYRNLDDSVLLGLSRTVADQQRMVDTHAAVIAGELARRSAPALGSQGLAQRTGHRTPEELVRVTTGVTKREAATAVRAGRLAVEAAGLPDPFTGELVQPERPWLQAVGVALAGGVLSVGCAESIRNGLGDPSQDVTTDMLAGAVPQLLAVAAEGMDADRLFRAARDMRNMIDENGIKDRERARYEARSLSFRKHADGSARLIWDMDPETATIAGDLYDRATSPRRGGPRFVHNEDGKQKTRSILDDTRTTEQLVSDVFLELLRHGADADTSQLLGTGAPVVTVYVTNDSLASGEGHGSIAGQPEPVSLETVERNMCSGGTQELSFDTHGHPLNLEREQRLFSTKQKKVLAAIWGGCGMGNCERPASWTEAHHLRQWARDHGMTNILDGILLCRYHHLRLHNLGCEIVRREHRYWLVEPDGTETELIPKNPTWRELVKRETA